MNIKPHLRIRVLLSPQDSDLLGFYWRHDKDGYAIRSSSPAGKSNIRLHRVVLERALGRALTSRDIVDHINGIKDDNRRDNLRLVSFKQNCENRHLGKYRGITRHKNGKWQAQVGHNGRTIYLGLFHTREDAADVATTKRKELGFVEHIA